MHRVLYSRQEQRQNKKHRASVRSSKRFGLEREMMRMQKSVARLGQIIRK
jgi:hypothetical protein